MTIIGIDLGTTNSLVSIFSDEGPVLVPNAFGANLTPSVVHLDKSDQVIVGASAKAHLINAPRATASKFKRLMGTAKVTTLRDRDFSAEDLSSLVLRSLKADAEAYLGSPVTEAVISVPAYFNEIQRKATMTAAQLAGLTVRRLINEPTAAALAYGLQDKDAEHTFLIVDLGGGTFDVSILETFSGVMEVRASAGDAFLGGEDFTDRIVADFARQLDRRIDQMAAADLSRLRATADQAKHALSDRQAVTCPFRLGDAEHALGLTRDAFEALTEDLINRMKVPLQRAISDADLMASDIDRIVLVGGATRMVPVRNLITRLFKRFPEHALDPDTVVALGAGVQAGLIARNAALDDIVMTDVAPFTLGYETTRLGETPSQNEGGLFAPLIERNTTIPASRSHVVKGLRKGQDRIDLRIFQGEAPYVRDNILIGSLAVPLPYNEADFEAVDVRFTYDNSGVLEVISTVLSTGEKTTLIIENSPGAISSDAIARRFKELDAIKIHPREEAVNEAMISRLTAAYENALGPRRTEIGWLLSQFEATLTTYDTRQIARMHETITQALRDLDGSDVFD